MFETQFNMLRSSHFGNDFNTRFLLGFFPRKADVALLAEERFKVVAGYDLLFVLKKCVDVLWTVLITLSMDGGEFVIFVPL